MSDHDPNDPRDKKDKPMTQPSTELVKAKPPSALTGTTSRDIREINQRLAWSSEEYHLVSPSTACATLPEGCSVAFAKVLIDVEAETYPLQGGKVGLGRPALDRIAAAAGISWDARESRRLDSGRDPRYVAWRAVGVVRHLDGTRQTILGNKEMDMRDGSPQVLALEAKARAKGRDATAQIQEMRLHILAHAETKARLRAIRSLGIRASYTPQDLQRPFVVARLMWTGQSDDPELRKMLAQETARAMLGADHALYGDAPQLHALPGIEPPPVGQTLLGDEDDETPTVEGTGATVEPPYGTTGPNASAAKVETKAPAAPPPPADPAPALGAAICTFGKNKGTKLRALEDDDLDWMQRTLAKNLTDPEKARWKAQNERDLASVTAEIKWRSGEEEPPEDERL